MATLGRGEVNNKIQTRSAGSPSLMITSPIINLSVVPAKIQPTATFGVQPSFVGGPIMREDFITTTGIMSSKL